MNDFDTFWHEAKAALRVALQWFFLAVPMGLLCGFLGTLFHLAVEHATELRAAQPWLLFLLPVAGLLINALYKVTKCEGVGTNNVIRAVQSGEPVSILLVPAIFLGTVLTHLCGGSAGREGAALQVGGSLGNFFAKLFHFDDKDTRIMIMCGMSACFSALFGTPISAAIFSMEVISVGVMYYAALVPCIISALIAQGIAGLFGITPTAFVIGELCSFNLSTAVRFIIMSILFALTSIAFCYILHTSAKLYSTYIENPYVRIVIAGILVIALRYITGTTDYLGAGAPIIASSFLSSCAWYVFILKMLFTAATLGGGFKGGEIVPTLFVGAALGSFLAPLLGLPVGLCAACGMVSVFCGVTNCPLTSFIISIEMFGISSMKFVIICIAISYMLSGYYSLYNSQKIVYSKYRTEYINRMSH